MKPARPIRHRLPGPAAGLRIGLLGGSFDPAHSGHAHLISVARRRLGLDAVWVIPAAGNPLKRTQTPFAERASGAQRLLAGPGVRVSTIERDLGLTYTIDLIGALQRLAPSARFVWIMGADNLRDFHRWRAWTRIAERVPIAIVSRPGASPKAGLSRFARRFAGARYAPEAASSLPQRTAPAWVYLTAPLDPTSSTVLRNRRSRLAALHAG